MKLLLKLIFLITFSTSAIATSEPRTSVIELTPTNMLLIRDSISESSIASAQKKLAGMLATRGNAAYPLYIVFFSPGGSVDAGLMLYETVKAYTNIHTIVIRGYSMAAILPQLIPGKRYIIETGEIMFHRISFAANRQQNPDQAQSLLNSVKALEAFIERKVLARTGLTVEEYRRKSNEEWWVNAQEAIDRNLMDEEVTIKCSKELLKQRTTITIQPLPFLPPMEIESAECPLLL